MRFTRTLILSTIVFFSVSSFGLDLVVPLKPNEVKTPGDICTITDGDFTEYRYDEGIPYCRRNVSFHRRQQIYDLYEIEEDRRHHYTIDHLIPLSIGGSNSDENLWPEHVRVKAARDRLELDLFWAVRRGEMTQAEAVEIVLEEKFNPPKDYILNQ